MIFGENNAVGVTGLPNLEDAEQTGKHRKDASGDAQGEEPGEESGDAQGHEQADEQGDEFGEDGVQNNSEQGRENKDD